MQFTRFSASKSVQSNLWTLAKTILKAQCQPRPMIYTLINLLAQKQLIAAVITTNIDGLEFMDRDLLPKETRGHTWEDRGWLHERPDLILRLHGTITEVFCNSCKGQRFSLNKESAHKLITGSYSPCIHCSTRARCASNRALYWRPDILFYGDSQEGLQAESMDYDYGEVGGRIQKGDGYENTLQGETERYRKLMSNASQMNSMFIVGSSLSSAQLKGDVVALTRAGIEVFVVNPHWSSKWNGLANCTWVNADAEAFADFIYKDIRSHEK